MKVIITGASGMVGKGVLLECLDHAAITHVLSLGRTPLKTNHPKLKEILIQDFINYDSISTELKGYDASYLCMGVSSSGKNKEDYHRLTFDYTLALAQTLANINPNMICTYVSGAGTDSTEKGGSMWARIKGKTENALLLLGFKNAYMFRPGAIIPLRGIQSKTKMYQFIYDYFMWAIKLMKKITPNSIVNTSQIGQAMIQVTVKGYDKNIIDPVDIIQLSEA